MFPKSLS